MAFVLVAVLGGGLALVVGHHAHQRGAAGLARGRDELAQGVLERAHAALLVGALLVLARIVARGAADAFDEHVAVQQVGTVRGQRGVGAEGHRDVAHDLVRAMLVQRVGHGLNEGLVARVRRRGEHESGGKREEEAGHRGHSLDAGAAGTARAITPPSGTSTLLEPTRHSTCAGSSMVLPL